MYIMGYNVYVSFSKSTVNFLLRITFTEELILI